MELLHRRCCGLDVHKETVVAGPTSTARSARMTCMRARPIPTAGFTARPPAGKEALLYGPRHHGEVQRSIAVCFEQKVVGDQQCEGGRNSTHRQRANRQSDRKCQSTQIADSFARGGMGAQEFRPPADFVRHRGDAQACATRRLAPGGSSINSRAVAPASNSQMRNKASSRSWPITRRNTLSL